MLAFTLLSTALPLWDSIRASPILIFATLIGAYGAFWTLCAAYYLSFHPLARYPGPRLAAISTWWIYLLTKTHKTEQKLELLHKRYNTKVLRIAPNELHINDPSYYHEIYSQKNLYQKDPHFYAQFNAPGTVFSDHDFAAQKERRRLMSPAFSKQTIARMQDVLNDKIERACNELSKRKNGGVVYMHNFFRCITVDVISELSFGSSFGLIDATKDNMFHQPVLRALDLVVFTVADFQYWPMYRIATNWCPDFITRIMAPQMLNFSLTVQAVQKALNDYLISKDSMSEERRDATIFKPLEHLTKDQLINESIDMIIAGSDTTATTLGYAFHEILKNNAVSKRLTAELDLVMPKGASIKELGGLDANYTQSAVVKESLRLAMPVPGRLPRIVPEVRSKAAPLNVEGRIIPPGTVVGLSAWTVHLSEDIWGSDARDFRPERWLGEDAKRLDRYLVTFSKGARTCLGINLAYAETRLVLAQLLRRFEFALDETMTPRDTEKLDCFTTAFAGTGPRIYVTGERM